MARMCLTRTYRWWTFWLSIGAAGVMAACASDSTAPAADSTATASDSTATPSDSTATPSDSTATPSDATSDSLLGKCQAQLYASSTVAIGPAGGVIRANGHKLTVPAGALDSTVTITMEAPSDTIRSVRFSPEGLTFNPAYRPVLDMDYSNCSLLSLLSKKIVYTDEQFNVLQQLLSLDLFTLFTVEADLDHFSRYAIHY